VTQPGPALKKAFRDLGVEPDADRATIRKAWKAMVRAYHPDQVGTDKAEANRRLADLNAAFDLVSAWSAQDLHAYAETRRACREAQERSRNQKKRAGPEPRAKADSAKTATQGQTVKARQQQEQTARQNARTLDRADTAKRNAKRALARKTKPTDTTAQAKFLATLLEISPRAVIRELGFA